MTMKLKRKIEDYALVSLDMPDGTPVDPQSPTLEEVIYGFASDGCADIATMAQVLDDIRDGLINLREAIRTGSSLSDIQDNIKAMEVDIDDVLGKQHDREAV